MAKLGYLEQYIRELSKPLVNEEIFFGFDDLSEEYDYGRDIYKEDIYEERGDSENERERETDDTHTHRN